MPKGEKYWENVREERLICGFKGVKERHIRFFQFLWCGVCKDSLNLCS
jgi:hypothetical protein